MCSISSQGVGLVNVMRSLVKKYWGQSISDVDIPDNMTFKRNIESFKRFVKKYILVASIVRSSRRYPCYRYLYCRCWTHLQHAYRCTTTLEAHAFVFNTLFIRIGRNVLRVCDGVCNAVLVNTLINVLVASYTKLASLHVLRFNMRWGDSATYTGIILVSSPVWSFGKLLR